MRDDLLARAREQAEQSGAPLRGAALLRIARVETVVDPKAARETFDRGLAAIRQLSGRDGLFLLQQAALLAPVVAPDRLVGDTSLVVSQGFESRILEVMLDHGLLAAAVSRLLGDEIAADFPFRMVQTVIGRVSDGDTKISLLRRAIAIWRSAPPDDTRRPPGDDFIQLFQAEWHLLPRAEAVSVMRAIVGTTLEQTEQPITASFGNEAVTITSWRAFVFFQMLHALRDLDPDQAELLIAEHPQLADAAQRFPNGPKSVEEEIERQRVEKPASEVGYGMVGSPADFPFYKQSAAVIA